jgi:hypothetical protein
MALLVLRRVGLCVGQNQTRLPVGQVCHLCGWLKLFFKKCAVEKNKNTEALAVRSAV